MLLLALTRTNVAAYIVERGKAVVTSGPVKRGSVAKVQRHAVGDKVREDGACLQHQLAAVALATFRLFLNFGRKA